MKKISAFLAALALFLFTAATLSLAARRLVPKEEPSFCTWTLEEKENYLSGLKENLLTDSIPVFGSSEFQHGLDTPYHPANLFADSDFHPLLLGGGYYQSLYHAITLAAIEPYLPSADSGHRKAVLILSPQWFRKTGVVDQAFSSRFSEYMYVSMLCNDRLSEETRAYLSSRTHTLLGAVDTKTDGHIQLHEKVLWKQEGTFAETKYEALWNVFLKEKDFFQLAADITAAKLTGTWPAASDPDGQTSDIDWSLLLSQAEADGVRENQNELYISDESYQKLLPYLPSKKDMNKDAKKGYQKSPEYDDLRCFLRVCRELDIHPLLVILPVNGYYYDYTGFPVTAREGYYENIRHAAAEFQAQTADFSDQEYTKYFFEDRVHIGKTGWVKINESIYRFYKEMDGI